MKGSIAAILVNWNSSAHALRCCASLRQQAGARDLQILVVDNDSRPAERALLRQGTGFLLLEAGANTGFAAACNLGAASRLEDYLLFVNPDIEALDDAVDCLACWLDDHPETAGAAGLLLNSGGQPDREFMFRPLPTLASIVREALLLDRLPALPGRRVADRTPSDGSGPAAVEQPPGACLMVRRQLFQSLGGFDAAFYPAWYEDVDLCRRMKDKACRLFLIPQARFRHQGHASLAELAWADFLVFFYRNQRRYFEKHHAGVEALIMRGAVCLGMLMRLAALPLVWDTRAGTRIAAASAYRRVAGVMLRRGPK